jgi:hypothetical protein
MKSLTMRAAILGLSLLANAAFAGSGGFIIRGKGIELGEAREMPQPEPPIYSSRTKKGQTFTLTAQGTASSRGQAGQPYEPDSGAWTYDRKMFTAAPAKKAPVDKTAISIRLKAAKTGKSRIRFAGKVLGYESKFDVDVEVE